MRVIGLFSGGKDSLTACHLMWKRGFLKEVLYMRTGVGLNENFDYVKQTCKKYGWILNVVDPKPGESYADFVRKFGFPGSGAHSMVMGFLKWHPMRKWVWSHKSDDIMQISGRRPQESKRRMGKVKFKYEVTENMLFYAPLFEWSDKQVWDYIKDNHLERCPVYDTMHMGGDCMCGAFSEDGEDDMMQTFHGYMYNKIKAIEKEYGHLHPKHCVWGNHNQVKEKEKEKEKKKAKGKLSPEEKEKQKQLDLMCGECSIHRYS